MDGDCYRRGPSVPLYHGCQTWVLMYVFSYSVSPAATSDRAEWRLLPTVVFQEFSNEERCRAAKTALEGSLREAGAKRMPSEIRSAEHDRADRHAAAEATRLRSVRDFMR